MDSLGAAVGSSSARRGSWLGPSREFLLQGKGLLGSFGIRGRYGGAWVRFRFGWFVFGASLFGMSNLLGSFVRFHFCGRTGGSGGRRVRD